MKTWSKGKNLVLKLRLVLGLERPALVKNYYKYFAFFARFFWHDYSKKPRHSVCSFISLVLTIINSKIISGKLLGLKNLGCSLGFVYSVSIIG